MAYYNRTSPYYSTDDSNGYLDVILFRNLPEQSDDILFEVTNAFEYRPDLLAFELYNDVGLWWVFAVRNKNKIKDPVFDMVAGLKIYLPKLSTIKTALGI